MDELSTAVGSYTTSGLAAASGYSVQQVRDLERLGVTPPAKRQPNGYHHFGPADDARHALQVRLRIIATRADALLRAGIPIADLIAQKDNTTVNNRLASNT